MIVIITNKKDHSSSVVIDWINYLGGSNLRINRDSHFTIENIKIIKDKTPSLTFNVDGNNYSLDDVSSFWYRRGDILNDFDFNCSDTEDQNLRNKISNNLSNELLSLKKTVHYLFSTKKSLGNFYTTDVTKLVVLFKAKEFGLDIPMTQVSGKKEDIQSWTSDKKDFITKPISEVLLYVRNIGKSSNLYSSYTEVIEKDTLDDVSSNFFPSLIQEKLDKDYELRIFYLDGNLDGKCFSMAIFSQLDKQTSVDFRKYNIKNPNRCVPYNLPESVSEKINNLMLSLNLDTGSIDMVVTKDNRYVFLEVNPVGQFGMTSGPCNYNLEKEIAKFLLNNE